MALSGAGGYVRHGANRTEDNYGHLKVEMAGARIRLDVTALGMAGSPTPCQQPTLEITLSKGHTSNSLFRRRLRRGCRFQDVCPFVVMCSSPFMTPQHRDNRKCSRSRSLFPTVGPKDLCTFLVAFDRFNLFRLLDRPCHVRFTNLLDTAIRG